MILFPNAKINIGLNIVSKGPDGYHNLETVLYPLAIRDAIEVVEAKNLLFTSSGINIPGKVEDNLCVKAYHLIEQDFKIPPVHIHLHKHIPIGAGLGGGSADASFLIKLLNGKFNLGMDNQKMETYATEIGSDCAFFIQNKPAFAFGRGDQTSLIDLDLSPYFIALVMPGVQVSTAEAYQGANPIASQESLNELIKLPISEWASVIKNDFEPSVFLKYPVILSIKDLLYDAGAIYASMSGSGSSVYGIFKKEVQLPALEKNNMVFYKV